MSDVRNWTDDVEDPGKDGEEWEPDDDNQITLPHNTYTLFFMFFLCLDPPKEAGRLEMAFFSCFTFINFLMPLLVHFTILGILTFYLTQLEYEESEVHTDKLLVAVSELVFVSFVCADFFETVEMAKWIISVPVSPKLRPMRTKYNSEKKRKEIVSALTRPAKLFTFVITIVPKFTFAMFLLIFGSKLVLLSPTNLDVLLNALAAFFLCEIDDYVYRFMGAPMLKKSLEDPERMPPLYTDQKDVGALETCDEAEKMCGLVCGPCCYAGMILSIGAGLWNMWYPLPIAGNRDGYEIFNGTNATNATNATLLSVPSSLSSGVISRDAVPRSVIVMAATSTAMSMVWF